MYIYIEACMVESAWRCIRSPGHSRKCNRTITQAKQEPRAVRVMVPRDWIRKTRKPGLVSGPSQSLANLGLHMYVYIYIEREIDR